MKKKKQMSSEIRQANVTNLDSFLYSEKFNYLINLRFLKQVNNLYHMSGMEDKMIFIYLISFFFPHYWGLNPGQTLNH
jgi:ribosomal protein L29